MLRALVVIAWITLVVQLGIAIQGPLGRGEGVLRGIINYLGYFTILTNGFCALAMTARALPNWRSRFAAFLRRNGTVTTAAGSIAIVSTVYHTILARTWNPQGIQLATDFVLHTLVPVGYLVFWWNYVPRGALAARDVPRWLVWPLAYCVYVFIRGALLGEYPYFFIDVPAIGYARAAINSVIVLGVFLAVCGVLVTVNRFAGRRQAIE
jgi:hypothetical protein